MKSMKRIMAMLAAVLLTGAICLSFSACSDDDDEGGDGGASGSAVVKIDCALGNKRQGHYNYKVTVKASGISASDVKDIGVTWGATSSADGKRSASATAGLSTVRSINLSAGSTVYLKGFVYTASGYSYSKVERIKVPK